MSARTALGAAVPRLTVAVARANWNPIAIAPNAGVGSPWWSLRRGGERGVTNTGGLARAERRAVVGLDGNRESAQPGKSNSDLADVLAVREVAQRSLELLRCVGAEEEGFKLRRSVAARIGRERCDGVRPIRPERAVAKQIHQLAHGR